MSIYNIQNCKGPIAGFNILHTSSFGKKYLQFSLKKFASIASTRAGFFCVSENIVAFCCQKCWNGTFFCSPMCHKVFWFAINKCMPIPRTIFGPQYYITDYINLLNWLSTHADVGPCSGVCACRTLHLVPHQHKKKFFCHRNHHIFTTLETL